ncbi:MAG: glutathione S-transferase family protein [Steroidobacteraceae bacterium]
MTDLILHSYDASPFTQRALKMLAIKGLQWRSVTTPMMPPKDDLLALTGGYRGTPVLQIGADIYIDSQRIAAELEARFPAPTLFPGGSTGLTLAGVKWADAFFRAGLHLAIAVTGSAWPPEFRRDRQALFPDIDFATCDAEHARSQLRAHAALLEDQLADGRAFLAGDAPGLWDIHAWTVPWVTRAVPGGSEAYAGFTLMAEWEQRVAALSEGRRIECSAQEAIDVAKAATPTKHGVCDTQDVQGLRAGMRVEVCPDDTQRGGTQGEIVSVTARGISVLRHDARCGEVVVHFPRLGYRVTRL